VGRRGRFLSGETRKRKKIKLPLNERIEKFLKEFDKE